jgi:hypothetical protein
MAVKNVSKNENKFFFLRIIQVLQKKGTLFQYVNQTDLIR